MPARAEARKAARDVKETTRQVKSRAKRQARSGARRVERGVESPWVLRTARLGYVIRGLLYGAMGLSGVGYALGFWQQPTDQRGALYLVGNRPEHLVVFVAVIVGLAGYSLWGFIRAAFDPLRRGDDPGGIAARLGFLWSGLSYAGLLLFTVQFVTGAARDNGANAIPNTIEAVMRRPLGTVLTVVIGAIATGVGLGQFYDAYKATFSKDLKRRGPSREERELTDLLGRFGMFSRGVIFSMLGLFVIQAALHHDPSRAQGMGRALQVLAEEPMGHVLLSVVAAGFIALGLHSIAMAKWVRMPRGA